eukprot:6182618-Pleurochrysis_carterae.AAC.1
MADARELGRDMHDRPRSVVERALTPQRMLDRPLNQQERSVVAATAIENGLMYGGVAGAVTSALVYAAHKFSPAFRSGVGVSAKTGMVVIASAGSFFAQSQLTLARATFDPAQYVQKMPEAGAVTGLAAHRAALGRLPVWQRAANYVYDHPARTSVGCVERPMLLIPSAIERSYSSYAIYHSTIVPLYAFIFGYESSQPATAAMPLSQRIIHTRVYGQGGGGKYLLPEIEGHRPASAEERTGVRHQTCREPNPFRVPRERRSFELQITWRRLTLLLLRFATMPIEVKAHDSDQKYGLKRAVLVPLVYAPLLPLSIIFLRHRVQKVPLTSDLQSFALRTAHHHVFKGSLVLVYAGNVAQDRRRYIWHSAAGTPVRWALCAYERVEAVNKCALESLPHVVIVTVLNAAFTCWKVSTPRTKSQRSEH